LIKSENTGQLDEGIDRFKGGSRIVCRWLEKATFIMLQFEERLRRLLEAFSRGDQY